MNLTFDAGRFSLELAIEGSSLFFASGPLEFCFNRCRSRRNPFYWEWSTLDHPPCGRSRPMRCRTLNAAWCGFELVLDWRRPVPGSVVIDQHLDDDGNLREPPDWWEEGGEGAATNERG